MYTGRLTGSFFKTTFLLDFWTSGIEMRLSAVSAQKGEREREISVLSVCSWSDSSLFCAVRGK